MALLRGRATTGVTDMNAISDLSWEGSLLLWRADGVERHVRLADDIAHALALRSGGIAVVEGPRAVLLDEEGRLKVSLANPFSPERGVIFYYFRYEGHELVLILAGPGGSDFKSIVDETSGELSQPCEAR